MLERPRPHKSVETIIEEARRGLAFLVDSAVLNGDLVGLSELQQRKIVATAHDNAAAYANDCVIPTCDANAKANIDFIRIHVDRAINFFFKADGKELKEQIQDSHK